MFEESEMIHLFQMVSSSLRKRKSDIDASLIKGNFPSFDAYKYRAGESKGLGDALTLVSDLMIKLEKQKSLETEVRIIHVSPLGDGGL